MSCSSLQSDFERVMNFYNADEEAVAIPRRGMKHNFRKKVNHKKFVKCQLIQDKRLVHEDIKHEETENEKTKHEETKHEKTKHEDIKHEETENEKTKHEETKHEKTKHEETKHEEKKHEETKHKETKHEETKHEEKKHEETKHKETKHEETKHEKTKHEETKHGETEHEETKHEETKHEETKHEETKHEETEHEETENQEHQIDETNMTNTGNECSAEILKDGKKLMKKFLVIKDSRAKMLKQRRTTVELICIDVESKIEKTERKIKQKWRIFGKRNLRIQLSKYEYVRGKYVEMLNNIKARLEFELYSIIQLPVQRLNERLI